MRSDLRQWFSVLSQCTEIGQVLLWKQAKAEPRPDVTAGSESSSTPEASVLGGITCQEISSVSDKVSFGSWKLTPPKTYWPLRCFWTTHLLQTNTAATKQPFFLSDGLFSPCNSPYLLTPGQSPPCVAGPAWSNIVCNSFSSPHPFNSGAVLS